VTDLELELKELEQWTKCQEFHDSPVEHINKVYARLDELNLIKNCKERDAEK